MPKIHEAPTGAQGRNRRAPAGYVFVNFLVTRGNKERADQISEEDNVSKGAVFNLALEKFAENWFSARKAIRDYLRTKPDSITVDKVLRHALGLTQWGAAEVFCVETMLASAGWQRVPDVKCPPEKATFIPKETANAA